MFEFEKFLVYVGAITIFAVLAIMIWMAVFEHTAQRRQQTILVLDLILGYLLSLMVPIVMKNWTDMAAKILFPFHILFLQLTWTWYALNNRRRP